LALFTVLPFCLSACEVASSSSSGSPDLDDQSSAERAVLNGFDAKSPALNAIGTVGLYSPDINIYTFWCTGTLIAPKLVLTAKHCAISTHPATAGVPLVNLTPMQFAVGADVNAGNPIKLYDVVRVDLSPVDEGGFIKMGNDVAVLHLKEAVVGVTPIAVAKAAFTSADVGRAFVTVGFGASSAEDAAYSVYTGKRAAGGVTIHAVEGQSYQALYGSWEKYYDFMVWLYGQDTVDIAIDIIKGWWNDLMILPEYELHAGGQPGNGQLCAGDDGSPLIGQEGGVRKVFGVASNSWFSPSSRCAGGTFFGIIGPKTREMLEAASQHSEQPAQSPRATSPQKITADDIRAQIAAAIERSRQLP